MPVNLNLLPQDFQISKSAGSAIKTMKALGVILIVVFIVFCLGLGAFFIYSKLSLNKLQTTVDGLKVQVKAQEKSEQQLILLKDRLSKIGSVRASSGALSNVNNMDSLISNMSSVSNIDEASININKMNLILSVNSNEDLVTFMDNLKKSTAFTSVSLASFNYNSKGYSLDVNFTNLDTK